MSLVAGYDSDSGSETETQTQPSSQKQSQLASLLPPVTQTQGSANAVPTAAARTGNKRRGERLQIKIDALDPDVSSSQHNDAGPSSKRQKQPSTTSGGHGLLGMLPAPTNKGPPPAPVNRLGVSQEPSTGAMALQEPSSEKKTKGNNDFRAMLGLKPSARNVKPSFGTGQAQQTGKSGGGGHTSNDMSNHTQGNGGDGYAGRHASNRTERTSDATMEDQVPGENEAASASTHPKDFFCLDQEDKSVARAGSAPRLTTISSAPVVEEESSEQQDSTQGVDPYEGWQQGPDGAWFPVTPAAHAAYQDYLATQAQQQAVQRAREVEMKGVDASHIQEADANANLEAWLAKRPADSGEETAADRRYAMAAASSVTPEQAKEFGLLANEEQFAEDIRRKTDKKVNFRARRKGQLSSLVQQAEDNREKLEERWAQQKASRAETRAKYGF